LSEAKSPDGAGQADLSGLGFETEKEGKNEIKISVARRRRDSGYLASRQRERAKAIALRQKGCFA